jgi:predicted SAM-dependent methyltransferase
MNLHAGNANGKNKRSPNAALRASLTKLLVCCIGSIVGLFCIFRYRTSQLSSNGTALGVASVSAASELLALGNLPVSSDKLIDRDRFQQTLSRMNTVLDHLISSTEGGKNSHAHLSTPPWASESVSVAERRIVGEAGKAKPVTARKSRKSGIRHIGGEGEEQNVITAPSLYGGTNENRKVGTVTAGQAEVNMMRATARGLIPQLLDTEAALSAMNGDFYASRSGTEISTLLLQARLSIARVVNHVEKVANDAANFQLSNIPKALHEDSRKGELKVQLGAAGDSALLGWLNIDIVGGRAIRTKSGPIPAELSMSIASNPLPMADDSCSYVYAAHTMEHIRFPDDASFVFGEVFRVLRPGGVFRIVVPDARAWLEAYVNSDRSVSPAADKSPFWVGAREHWAAWQWGENDPITGTRLPVTLRYLGAMETDLEMNNPHKTGYDFETIRAALIRAGFTSGNIVESNYMASKHQELKIDDTSEAAGAAYSDKIGKKKYFSLFLEATKVQDNGAGMRHEWGG